MNIEKVIQEIEDFERELNNSLDPSYYEIEYMDSATDHFIQYGVEGYPELKVLFEEKEHVKEMRLKEYYGEITTDELNDYFGQLNELNDQYDFDKVVAYRIDDGKLVWL